MKIVEVHLDGFGRLVDCNLTFESGFNLIFGLNETGKSTLQRAIVALLYGFFNQGRIKASDREIATSFRPWDEATSYTGSLIYTLDDGQSFQVKRTFGSTPETAVFLFPDGSDISNKFKQHSYGRLFFAEKHLGMGREVFENTSYIRQAELIALENSASAITDTLMRLSATASTATTTTKATDLLKDMHKEKVGSSRAWTKPLTKTRNQLAKLEEERSQVLETRRELSLGMIELNQAKAQVRKLENEHKEIHYLETLARSKELQIQLNAANEVAEEINDLVEEMARWKNWANFPVHLRDEVIKLTTQHNTLKEECQEVKSQAEEAKEKRQSLTEEIVVIEGRIEDLTEVKDVQSDALADVQDLANRWKLSHQESRSCQERWQKAHLSLDEAEQQLAQEFAQLELVVKLGHSGLAQLEQQWLNAQAQVTRTVEQLTEAEAEWARVDMTEEQFKDLEQRVQHIQTAVVPIPKARRGCKLFSSRQPAQPMPQTPTEIKIYEDLKPIYDKLVRARVAVEEARQALTKAEADIHKTLKNPNGKTLNENMFAELNQKLEQYRHAEADVKQQKKTVADLQTDLETAHQQEGTSREALQMKLAKLGFDTSNLKVAIDTYVEQCKQKVKLEQEETTLEKLRLQIQAHSRVIEQWQKKQQSLEEVEAKLYEILTKADIEYPAGTDTLKATLDKFKEGVENHKRWAEAQQSHESALKRQETLDGIEMYQESLAELEDKLSKMRNEQPELAKLQADEAPKTYATKREQLEQELLTTRNNQHDLQNAIDQITGNFRHLAEIDEEIGQVKACIQKLEWYGKILEQAQLELTKATEEFQKQFAPKLEALMDESINRITHGRYADIHVDPKSLAVSMTAPEIGQAVSVERLSTGTRELVYLMLRVSIARLMSRSGEYLPLLLDDPLVQSDRGRQEQTLAFLSQLAEEMQVFLFTKDEWIKGWFEKKLKSSPEHRLHRLD